MDTLQHLSNQQTLQGKHTPETSEGMAYKTRVRLVLCNPAVLPTGLGPIMTKLSPRHSRNGKTNIARTINAHWGIVNRGWVAQRSLPQGP